MVGLALLLGAGCAPVALVPPPAAPAASPLDAFGPLDPARRCQVAPETGVVLVQGDHVVAWRGPDAAEPTLAPSPSGAAMLTRGAVMVLDDTVLREVGGDRVVPLPGAGIARPPLRAAVQPGRDVLAVWSERDTGPVLIIDPSTGALLRLLGEQPVLVTGVAFAGRDRIATADRDGWVRIWGATGARPEAALRPFGGEPPAVLVAGSSLVVVAREGEVWIWRTEPAGLVGRLSVPGAVTGASLDGGLLALAVRGAGVLVWSVGDARAVAGLPVEGVQDVCIAGTQEAPWGIVVVRADGTTRGGMQVAAGSWGPPASAATWDPAPADPTQALGPDAFVALYQRIRCEQQRGDARTVVEVLRSHGVGDLATWTAGAKARLAGDPELLQRIAAGQAPPCM